VSTLICALAGRLAAQKQNNPTAAKTPIPEIREKNGLNIQASIKSRSAEPVASGQYAPEIWQYFLPQKASSHLAGA
jgi:hypothetical protein